MRAGAVDITAYYPTTTTICPAIVYKRRQYDGRGAYLLVPITIENDLVFATIFRDAPRAFRALRILMVVADQVVCSEYFGKGRAGP